MILIFLFPFLSHPLRMGLTILSLTILIASFLGIRARNLWVSYILILVILGGLLVIFIYISLLVSNEIFSKKFTRVFILIILSSLFIIFLSIFLKEKRRLEVTACVLNKFNLEGYEWLSDLYSRNLSFLTIFLIFYLLLTLIVVVTIIKSDCSALRRNY